jgi:hypothetical protein
MSTYDGIRDSAAHKGEVGHQKAGEAHQATKVDRPFLQLPMMIWRFLNYFFLS